MIEIKTVIKSTDPDTLLTIYQSLADLSTPFYYKSDFYIFLAIGLASLIFSWLAFSAAKSAKQAAEEAGKTVKIQTVAVELSEISIKLDRLDGKMTYFSARDLLNEISRKIRRLLSNINYIESEDFEIVSGELIETLDKAKKALNKVKPTTEEIDKEAELESVYFAIEDYFYTISNKVADLIGILERKSLDIGNSNE